MSARTILNIDTGNRTINPRSGSSVYVDLLTDQSISGIKRFLSNLITNANVNFNTTANIGRIVFKPNEIPSFSGNLLTVYTTDENDGAGWIFDANGNLYYLGAGLIPQKIIFTPTGDITAIGSITGGAGSFTTGAFSSNVNITGASLGLTISGGFSGLFCNKIESQSGGAIVSSAVFNLRSALAVTNIVLDPLNTIRLKINGITGTNSYLFFNNANLLGFFNTSTGTNTWSITDLGAITCNSITANSFSVTSFLCNSISPLSGTVITFGITSNCNWLKSAGVNRILMFPSSTAGDIMQICRTGDTSYTSGYWYFNNTGNMGYNTAGVSVWELQNTGVITTNGGFISNGTQNNFNSSGTRAIYVPNGTIETYRLLVNDSGNNSISVPNGGVTAYRLFANNYIQCLGQYIYCEHSTTADVCGLWSNRTGVGGTIHQNGNSWSAVLGMECNTNGAIGGGGFNSGSLYRQFIWFIENTTGSGKALGLGCNRTPTLNSTINTATQNINYALLGYYATNRGGGAYSFTGEHSSMVCDEEYDDIMNYNTDDFLGMVVCSTGKIYNLPYNVDGDTYTKQVDNIKPVDTQPMTRLSKKYKDKSVLGVICHIEKVGKNRNDLGATSWTGCLSLDKDERRRIRVASIGEGAIWITNEYGNIENGDYITTSKIAGYSTKQDTDFLMNYTIAKATMNCEFDIEKPDEYKTRYLGDGIYASYIACTFHCG